MESKISIKNYIHTVRNYLKKEETESSPFLADSENPGNYETFTSPSTGMQFVLIPAGEFDMGSPSEEKDRSDSESPVHKVTIQNSFYLGKSAVTQKQWKKVMGNNPSHFKGEDRPAEVVSWEDAQEFVTKLNEKEETDKYCLPSETEWEYACRAGTHTRYFFGDDEPKLNEHAWYSGNSDGKTHTIGQKKPNPGDFMTCMGMSGNGCRTSGMKITMGLLQIEPCGKKEIPSIGFLMGAAGTAILNFAVRLAASGANLKAVSAIWAFAS